MSASAEAGDVFICFGADAAIPSVDARFTAFFTTVLAADAVVVAFGTISVVLAKRFALAAIFAWFSLSCAETTGLFGGVGLSFFAGGASG